MGYEINCQYLRRGYKPNQLRMEANPALFARLFERELNTRGIAASFDKHSNTLEKTVIGIMKNDQVCVMVKNEETKPLAVFENSDTVAKLSVDPQNCQTVRYAFNAPWSVFGSDISEEEKKKIYEAFTSAMKTTEDAIRLSDTHWGKKMLETLVE